MPTKNILKSFNGYPIMYVNVPIVDQNKSSFSFLSVSSIQNSKVLFKNNIYFLLL